MALTVKNLKMIVVLLCLGIGAFLFTHVRIQQITKEEMAGLEVSAHKLSELIETEMEKRSGLERELKKLREEKERLNIELESKRMEIKGLRERLQDAQ